MHIPTLLLQNRSSVVFGVFLGVGAFFFAFLRAYAPPLMIMSIFGTIGLDIFCVRASSCMMLSTWA